MSRFYRCDFCGVEILGGNENDLKMTKWQNDGVSEQEEYDLCDKCYESVVSYVRVFKASKQDKIAR